MKNLGEKLQVLSYKYCKRNLNYRKAHGMNKAHLKEFEEAYMTIIPYRLLNDEHISAPLEEALIVACRALKIVTKENPTDIKQGA